MKLKFIFPFCLVMLFCLVTLSCHKENTAISADQSMRQSNAAVATDTISIPLIDMGAKTYRGFNGGLYPDGTNTPSGQYAQDLDSITSTIIPLDSFGNPAPKRGRIGFIGIGASTCQILFNGLTKKTTKNPLTNARLGLATCTKGSTFINEIMDPTTDYWHVCDSILHVKKLNARQVQVIYLETDDSLETNGWPERPLRTKDETEDALRTFKTKFQNLKVVYIMARTRTWVHDKIRNAEPSPYYNSWACKWMVEDQINGVSGTEYKGPSAVAPIVTWGWYQWATGTLVPRSDGFVWQKTETRDGLHANATGQDTLASRFQNFLLTDHYAKKWYSSTP